MFTHVRHLTIEWGDCDPAGIVWYPRYFGMFDVSTAALFEAALGMNKKAMQKHYAVVGFPMVDTHGKFHVPTSYGDAVRIESHVEKFGRSSFEVVHRLMKGESLAVEGFEKRVWVGRHPDDPERIKAMPLPEELIRCFDRPS